MLRSQRTDGPTYDQFVKNALEKEEVEPKALHSKQSLKQDFLPYYSLLLAYSVF